MVPPTPPVVIKPINLPIVVDVELRGYTLLCYRVPVARMRPFVPASLPLYTEETADGPMTWFTIFLGLNVLKGLGPLPALPLQFYQINYRAYVAFEGERSLFIFRSLVSDPISAKGARYALGFPAVFSRIDVSRGDYGSGFAQARIRAEGELDVQLQETAALPEVPGFATPGEAKAFLADVPNAFYLLKLPYIGKLVAAHPPLKPMGGQAIAIALPWLVREGLLTPEEARHPQAIYLQERAPFPLRL